jgi:hypothetical protein
MTKSFHQLVVRYGIEGLPYIEENGGNSGGSVFHLAFVEAL